MKSHQINVESFIECNKCGYVIKFIVDIREQIEEYKCPRCGNKIVISPKNLTEKEK